MSSVGERNMRATRFTAEWIQNGKAFSVTREIQLKYHKELTVLGRLIPIKQAGFRGVVLTAIVGKYINPNFRPLEDFYDCNPRSIFEHGIRHALKDAKIPCGKSDPLNVAKNIQKLDYSWAQGRRPESAAKAAVDYLKLLEEAFQNEERYRMLLTLYFNELYKFGASVNSQNTPIEMKAESVPIQMGEMLADFAVECPEGGAIPQFIVGHLIAHLRQDDKKFLCVDGYNESVYGTNTTSKKPADVWEVMEDKTLGALYEVTVKAIDRNRLDDSVDSLRKQNANNSAIVTFICNLPHDIVPLGIDKKYMTHQGVGFQFIDIMEFIRTTYCLLTDAQRNKLLEQLQDFVFDHNRPTKTKKYWNDHIVS